MRVNNCTSLLLEKRTPTIVSDIQSINLCPEIDAQPVKVGTNRRRVWIPSAEASIPNKFCAYENLKLDWDNCDNVVNALGMKISTEPQKLRRQESRIRIIDLLRCESPSSLSAANHCVGIFNLV